MRWFLVLPLVIFLAACHKKPAAPTEPMVTPVANPDRLIFSASLNVAKENLASIKKTDIFLWDLKDELGRPIASRIIPVPKFPFQLRVTAREMVRAIPEKTVLLFSARVVHFGDEHKMPMKGQLSLMAGIVPPKQTVNNPHVDQKRLQKWEKKNDIIDDEVLPIGASVKANLTPSPW